MRDLIWRECQRVHRTSGTDARSPLCWALAAFLVHLIPASLTYWNATGWAVISGWLCSGLSAGLATTTRRCLMTTSGIPECQPSDQRHYFVQCIKHFSWASVFHLAEVVRGKCTISPYNFSGWSLMCSFLELEMALSSKCFNFHLQTSSLFHSTKTHYEIRHLPDNQGNIKYISLSRSFSW